MHKSNKIFVIVAHRLSLLLLQSSWLDTGVNLHGFPYESDKDIIYTEGPKNNQTKHSISLLAFGKLSFFFIR